MRRDLNLVRALLLHIEGKGLENALEAVNLDIPPWTSEQVVYHCLLLDDAGYIEARDASTMAETNMLIFRMTASGHDYLDAVRSDTVWRAVTDRLKGEGISAGLELAKSLALSITSKMLGI